MSKSTKAVLLSALVFPGTGHFFLRRHMFGGILAGVSILAVYFLVSRVFEMALEIADKIKHGEAPPDLAEITSMVTSHTMGGGLQELNYATYALVICWVIGIVDSYRVGTAQDKEDALVTKT